MGKNLDAARMRLAEAQGRLTQADESRSDIDDLSYYMRESFARLAESVEAILDYLEALKFEVDDE